MSRTYDETRGGQHGIGAIVGLVSSGILMLIAIIATLGVMFGSWYTIDQSQRGVLLRNGAIVQVVQPGLNFKWPWIESVTKIDMQTHTIRWGIAPAKMEAYSADQQPADLIVSVTFRVAPDKVAEIYSRFGGDQKAAVDRLITPLVNKEAKIVFGQFTAARAVTQRGPLNADVATALTAGLAYDPVFIIESVQIENISFSPAYINSVDARMQAEVEVQKFQQNLAREKVQADIAVTQATGRANSVRAEAQANADAIRLRGDAEATAIKARGAALGENPRLVDLVQAERWDGKLPATMIPGGAVPMIGLGGR